MNTDIERFAGDTYPEKHSFSISGTTVNLDGWDTYMYYDEIQPDLSVVSVRITGVVGSGGAAKFYPRDMYCYDVTNSVAYVGMSVAGVHAYSIVRSKDAYEQNDAGTHVYVLGEYVLYDAGNVDHDGLQLYSVYVETMTHLAGTMTINDRAGL